MADTPSLPDGPALIVVGGPTDGEVFPLEQDRSLIVGSGRLANLRLGPSDISSAHIKVTWDDAGLFVNDNTSFTGTYLNGEVVEQAPLQDGDLIAFADPKDKPDWPKLRVHVPAGSVIITAPPPEPEPAPTPPAAEPPKIEPPKARAGANASAATPPGLARGPRPGAGPSRAPGDRHSGDGRSRAEDGRGHRRGRSGPRAVAGAPHSLLLRSEADHRGRAAGRWESPDRSSPSGVIALARMRR